MDLSTALTLLEDPNKRQELVKQFSEDADIIEGENGKPYKMVRLKDITLPLELLVSPTGLKIHYRDPTKIKLRDDDIILFTYPKTGTHWTYNILHFLIKTGSLDDALSATPIFFELLKNEEVESLPSRRIFATHMVPGLLPENTFKSGRKMIILYRNPKDTATSMYHHGKTMQGLTNGAMLSWECYIDSWMKDLLPFYGYFNYYTIWQQTIKAEEDVDFLTVNFEDLIAHGVDELERIQRYLGLSHSKQRLKHVLDRCTLSNLKADVESKRVTTNLVTTTGESFIYRKGIVGDWKNHFTVAQSEQMDLVFNKKFENSVPKPNLI